jgi:ketosteroid isomerase-like protein
MNLLKACLAALMLVASTGVHASETAPPAALAVADQLHEALAAGDRERVRSLLMADVLVYEMGVVEASFAEYAKSHLGADIDFTRQVKRDRVSRSSGGAADLAWVATQCRVTGTYNKRPIDNDAIETLILRRTSEGWRIAHIHWSSAPHR